MSIQVKTINNILIALLMVSVLVYSHCTSITYSRMNRLKGCKVS